MPVCRRAVMLCLVVLAFLMLPIVARGQQPSGGGTVQPMCVEGCLGDHPVPVVTPDGVANGQRQQNTGGYATAFFVSNTGPDGILDLVCEGSGGVTCDGVSTATLRLPQGQSATVFAYYHVGTSDGTLSLTATARPGDLYYDAGSYTVDVVTGAPAASVLVTPQGNQARVRNPNSGPFTDTFTVTNTGTASRTFSLLRYCANSINCLFGGPTSVTLGPGAQAQIGVSYETYTENPAGEVGLQANASDARGAGVYPVRVGLPEHAPGVALAGATNGLADRGLCLVLGAGEAAANQCGDLTVAHAMPTVRSIGRDRNLTLVYSSPQATGSLLVPARVTLGMPYGIPDTVIAYLRVNTSGTMVLRDSARYTPWGNPNGVPLAETRQIVLQFSGGSIPTGAYPFQLEVRNVYTWDQGHVYADTASGTLLLVNRSASEFGRGWAVAGVERIYFNQPAGRHNILWTAGDGSAALYDSVGVNTWVAPRAEFRDTIRFVSPNYVRYLRHGVQVVYDGQGRHIQTINRVGQATAFYWNTVTPTQLDSITIPPTSIPYHTYRFFYTGGKLDNISDPVARVLDATVTSGNLVSLKDPDLVSTTFAYDGAGRMTSRTSRMGTINTYTYDLAGRLAEARLRRDSVHVDTTRYQAWDALGLRRTDSISPAALTDTVRTTLDGPRSDVTDRTRFWIGAFGEPDTIVNALGQTTRMERGDTSFPAQVTKVIYPTGWTVRQVYNSRGNLTDVVDSTGEMDRPLRHSTWTYDPTYPDEPATVKDGLNRTTSYTYASPGLTSSVTDPRGHVTEFDYASAPAPAGLLAAVTEKQVQTWRELPGSTNDTLDTTLDQVTSFTYDTRGNVQTVISAAGLTSAFVNDSAGRVVKSYTPTGVLTQRVYDKLNRVTTVQQYTQPQALPYGLTLAGMPCDTTQLRCADSARAYAPVLPAILTTSYYYGLAGLDSVADPRLVKQRYRYNADGSVRETRDETDQPTRAFINALGMADSVLLRTGFMVRFQYDVLGRLAQRSYAARQYTMDAGIWGSPPPVHTVPADSERYVYDASGQVASATNRWGEIRRNYFADGSLRGQHTFNTFLDDSLTVTYDAAGARLSLRHVGAGRADSVRYTYDTGGTISQYQMFWGGTSIPTRTVTVGRDALGRRRLMTYPGGLRVQYRYDKLGRLRRVVSLQPAHDVAEFMFRNRIYDANGQLLQQNTTCAETDPHGVCGGNTSVTMTNGYNHLGWLVRQAPDPVIVDSMGYDASGNVTYKASRWPIYGDSTLRFTIGATSNRISAEALDGATSSVVYSYEADGSRHREQPTPQDNSYRERWYYYDGLGRPAGMGRYRPYGFDDQDSCHYDADGQLFMGCEEDQPAKSFDGAQVVAAEHIGVFHFVQGDGLDDPIIGVGTQAGNPALELFYVTDGAGRVFVAVDSTGHRPVALDQDGWMAWSAHGGASVTQGYGANRLTTGGAPDIAYYRNRLYDQHTGRWTQEDPLGVAGGLNLYQFNGNNPVAYSDPFGLCDPKDPNDPFCALAVGVASRTKGLVALEPAMMVVASLPTMGAPAAGAGISTEVLELGNVLRTSTNGLLRAGGVATRVADAVGGTVSALRSSEGYRVTVESAKNIVARIKTTGEMRVSIDGVGSLTREGIISADRALTHLRNLSSQEVVHLINKAKTFVEAIK